MIASSALIVVSLFARGLSAAELPLPNLPSGQTQLVLPPEQSTAFVALGRGVQVRYFHPVSDRAFD